MSVSENVPIHEYDVPGNILVHGFVFFAICSLFVSREGEEEHSQR